MSPEYVLDKMLLYEVAPYIRNIHLANKESWELARLGAYITALVNSKKKLKVTDIVEFPWEKKPNTIIRKGNTSISDEDILRLKNKAKKYICNEQI